MGAVSQAFFLGAVNQQGNKQPVRVSAWGTCAWEQAAVPRTVRRDGDVPSLCLA